jgi:hypothetical protein
LPHFGHLFNFTFFKAWCERPRRASLLDLRLAGTDIKNLKIKNQNEKFYKTIKFDLNSDLQLIVKINLIIT